MTPQVGAVRSDVDKLKSRLKTEKVEREALAELTALHSDVFVDVQKKLEGHSQKHKTHEMQVRAFYNNVVCGFLLSLPFPLMKEVNIKYK
jgi:hypothetical protein